MATSVMLLQPFSISEEGLMTASSATEAATSVVKVQFSLLLVSLFSTNLLSCQGHDPQACPAYLASTCEHLQLANLFRKQRLGMY